MTASLDRNELIVVNTTTNETIPVDALGWDGNTAWFVFADQLPDGNYVATLPAGSVEDAAGNGLESDVNFGFFVLAGDANRDRKVDLSDFAILRNNFGTDSTFSQGDFNYDGRVDLADFAMLRELRQHPSRQRRRRRPVLIGPPQSLCRHQTRCPRRRRIVSVAAEVHGYAADPEDDRLTLFYVVDATADEPLGTPVAVPTTPKAEVDHGIRRLLAFAKLGRDDRHDIEQSLPAAELAEMVRGASANGVRLVLQVLTTGRLTDRAIAAGDGRDAECEVSDVVRRCGCSAASATGPPTSISSLTTATAPVPLTPPAADGLRVCSRACLTSYWRPSTTATVQHCWNGTSERSCSLPAK